MTVTIPEWLLWIGGGALVLIILVLAVFGFFAARAMSGAKFK